MKFIGRLKEKIIHWCGGFTLEEKLREPIRHEIVKVEAPIRKINFERKYFIDTPRDYIDKEMAKEIGNFILENGLYEVHTTNSKESPNLLYSIYTVYIVKKRKRCDIIMYVETIDDIIRLIKNRDHLSIKEARIMVDECVEEIRNAINEYREYEIEDILMEHLNLEPDFLEVILNEI